MPGLTVKRINLDSLYNLWCDVVLISGGTRKSKGFGYVTYAFEEDAQKAKDSVKTLKGRPLSILFSDKKPRTNRSEKKSKERKRENDGDDSDDDGDDDVDDKEKYKKKKQDTGEVNNNEQGRAVSFKIFMYRAQKMASQRKKAGQN